MTSHEATHTTTTTAAAWPFPHEVPSQNWRPGKRPTVKKNVKHTVSGAMSMLRSAARREDFDVPDLAAMAEQELPYAILAVGIENLRRQGHSWAVIGTALGVNRVSAFQRFQRHQAEQGVVVDG